jgi:tripartite-type tricarboxylate transporter receptor subunit TctC
MEEVKMAKKIVICCLFFVFAFIPFSIYAKNFPSSPVTIIVGYGGGGSTDLATRIVSKGMSEYLGVPVLVNNMPGGGGIIALGELWKTKPDGYTLAHGNLNNLGCMPEAIKKAPYKPLEFSYVGRFLDYAGMIWTSTKAPWKNFEEMVEWGKKNPGELVYAAEEVFGINPVGVFKLFQAANPDVKYTTMVTSGSGETVKNVIAKDADFCYISVIPCMEHYKAGLVTPLLSMAPYPMPGFEAVPVVTDKYLKRAYMDSCGLLGPPGIPEPVRQKLEDALKYAIENKEIQAQLKKLGAVTYFVPGNEYRNWYMSMRDEIQNAIKILKQEKKR